MYLPNLRTAPMTFKKDDLYGKKTEVCDLTDFSEIWNSNTTQDKFSNH